MPKFARKIYRHAKEESENFLLEVASTSHNDSIREKPSQNAAVVLQNTNSDIENPQNIESTGSHQSKSNERDINSQNTQDGEEFLSSEDYFDEDYFANCSDSESSQMSNQEFNEPTSNNPIPHVDTVQTFDAKLALWAIENDIKRLALSGLLKILRCVPGLEHLPSDSRTLLSTPRNVELKEMTPGFYHHFGLKSCVEKLLDKEKPSESQEEIAVAVNIDGLPISKSSGSQLYPILCSLFNGPNVEIIGVYHGYEKPHSANDLLHEFVEEAIALTTNGIVYNNKFLRFKVKLCTCDAPAKSFVTNVKGHTGYGSCTKCHQRGDYVQNRVCFPYEARIRLRTDEEFCNKIDEEYHLANVTSAFELIPGFGMVTNFPLDYMHLVCLGVVKKLIVLWCYGPPKTKIPYRDTLQISSKLLDLVAYVPEEFGRKPRELSEVKRWKAIEFRQFLLYTGPVVLKHVLDSDRYLNFLCLHVACRILASQKLSPLMDYAEQLLHFFVKTFIQLYGTEHSSHNIHNLLHLTDDVKRYGPLDAFSAFKFENHMQKIKKYIHKHSQPLSQVVYRKKEEDAFITPVSSAKKHPAVRTEHTNGPLLDHHLGCRQYKEVNLELFTIKTQEANNCCALKDGTICLVRNCIVVSDEILLIVQRFKTQKPFYINPCQSSEIQSYLVDELSPFQICTIENVDCKCVRLKYTENSFVVLPLVHA